MKIDRQQSATLSDLYFWDGKRFWQWNPSNRTFVDYRTADFKLHLRCGGVRNVEDRLEDIKRDYRIDVALPVALHSAGELIKKNGRVLLCTQNLELPQQQSPGLFPIIRSALEGILGSEAEAFIIWMREAYHYLLQEGTIRPPILCSVGPCPSGKGLLSRIANSTITGRWRPMVYQGRWRDTPVTETISSLVHLIDLSYFHPYKLTLKKLKELISAEPKRVEGIELVLPQVFMARCHDCNWPEWEEPFAELTGKRILVLKTAKEFSIKSDDGRMDSEVLIQKISAEIPAFRHHLRSGSLAPSVIAR